MYAMQFNNPNSGYTVFQNYQVTFYSADGTVMGADGGQVTLHPNATAAVTGIARTVHGDLGQITRAEYLAGPIFYRESAEMAALVPENLVVDELDTAYPHVTFDVTNNTGQDIDQVSVAVIAYNDAGEIVGGDRDYIDELTAGETIALEAWVTTWGPATRFEVYMPYDIFE
jgi:hypothetical protein